MPDPLWWLAARLARQYSVARISRFARLDCYSLKERLETLNRAMPELREGDLLAFSSIPERGTVVEVNGKTAATIPGADFAKVLFSIWLGPSPPNTALREGLLGHR